MRLRLNRRGVWYGGLLVAVVTGCVVGATVVYYLLFSSLPDDLGVAQMRQSSFDLWVAAGMALGGLSGAVLAWAAHGLARRIPAKSLMASARRCRFSLKTMFVALTLVALAAGLFHWRKRVAQERGGEWEFASQLWYEASAKVGTDRGIPWYRRIVGDIDVRYIVFRPDVSAVQMDRFRTMFPEATITQQKPHKDSPAGQVGQP